MNQRNKIPERPFQFEEKVFVIADEVLSILKTLSSENKKQIDSKLLAEKMFWSDSVKNLLSSNQFNPPENSNAPDYLMELSKMVLDRFSELVPVSMTDNYNELKERFKNTAVSGESTEWLDSPIEIIKKYITSISGRNSELEDFLKQTITYLSETEKHLSKEVSCQNRNFEEDRQFEDSISSDISSIEENFIASADVNSIKKAVFEKIGLINKKIRKKREQDILRLKETDNALNLMKNQMETIKVESEEIRKRAHEIEYESARDTLTGLFNRKSYDQKVQETLTKVQRYNVSSCLMVCDIDYFKKINDRFGHKVGDLALKKLAALLKERLRTDDYVARYGGEEFVIILPNADLNGAQSAGEGIRSYINESIFSFKGEEIPLTISVGISSFKKEDDTSSVFERADTALYFAKRSGRNAVKTEQSVPANVVALNSRTHEEP